MQYIEHHGSFIEAMLRVPKNACQIAATFDNGIWYVRYFLIGG